MKKRIGLTLGALALVTTTALAVAGPGGGDCGGPGGGHGAMGSDGYAMHHGMMHGQGGSGMHHGMMREKGGAGMHGGRMGAHGKGAYGKGTMGPRMLQRLDWALELNGEQRDQVRSLLKQQQGEHQARREQMRALHRQLNELDPAASDYESKVQQLAEQQAQLMAKMWTQRGQLHAQIGALLSPEQQATWDEMHRQMGDHRGHHQDPS
ncbi:Spy/CpxP family protein refolding chaperone [Motiliproteus sp. SC1-56]|uniref:Spy/CpxP family protein refolding chaperone n=1 Tax=Motiliproteus sp. SC1-56 TaxID=2799565 RepID=UPI001A8E4E26|nr:Spy/CpxP family protein refolding chaperone [Motiliproteus sp. SC1-56]